MEKSLEKGFFNRHKYVDVIKYWEIFMEEMKLFLPYFIEFEEDDIILLKQYLNNYVVGGSDQWLIIIIINDKSIFFANNSH